MNWIKHKPYDGADIFTVKEYRAHVKSGMLIDYDGYGYGLIRDKKGWKSLDCFVAKPSQTKDLPKEITHIDWFNK